jgi:hypothetical protein
MKNTSEIDFILDDIRKACELGKIDEVIKLSEKLKTLIYQKQKPLNWLKNKLSIFNQ